MKEIPVNLVQELRQKTGAGMMNCKKALQQTNGNITKATEWLRQNNIGFTPTKLSSTTAGIIGYYIHTGSQVGVLIEVNCETDFVARSEEFQNLVRNIAMQVAACPNVEYVKVANIPPEIVEKEKQIEMGRDDLKNKPENIKEKIVQGRIEKRLKEMSLMDQPYIRDQSMAIADLVKQAQAQFGENIQVRRFVRYTLGEGIE